MSVLDLFWLFFMLSALQPVMRQRMMDAMRTRKIAQLERVRNSRVILLVHRQETMRLLGFPVMRYIDVNDSEEVLRAIRLTDEDVPLDIILHTPGGLVLAATQIARAIRDRKSKVTVFVPHYAMSGGTLIALAADEIVMSPHAALGPIDPQFEKFAAASLLKVLEQKPMEKIDDETSGAGRCRSQSDRAGQSGSHVICSSGVCRPNRPASWRKSCRRARGRTTIRLHRRRPGCSVSRSIPICRRRCWS